MVSNNSCQLLGHVDGHNSRRLASDVFIYLCYPIPYFNFCIALLNKAYHTIRH